MERTTFSAIHSIFHSAREFLNPLLVASKFKETGVLTPAEFVLAGDLLCTKFPTWKWESGEPSKKRDYLPDNKQYLVTRNIPCATRASQMHTGNEDNDELLEDADEHEWVGVTFFSIMLLAYYILIDYYYMSNTVTVGCNSGN